MDIQSLLTTMVEKGASDLFVTAGVPPSIKLNGKMTPISNTKLSPEATRELVLSVMNEDQRKEFIKSKELNFAISARGIGRFRASAFYQRNLAGIVVRRIETNIPKIDDLGLPDVIKDLAMTKRGLVIFVGATGTGKSTSLAAMVGHRNTNSHGHIISVEDPIEFIHQQIVALRDQGKAILLVSVELEEVLSLADRIVVMFDGQIMGERLSSETDERELGMLMAGMKQGADA